MLLILLGLPQLHQPRGKQAFPQRLAAPEQVPSCLKTFWILPSSRQCQEPPSHHLWAESPWVPLCCCSSFTHLHVCNFPLQMGKSAGAGACSPFFHRIAPLGTALQSLGEEGSSDLPDVLFFLTPHRSPKDTTITRFGPSQAAACWVMLGSKCP